MFIHVAVFLFLFLARVRFPKSKSTAEVIRSRYSENTVKRICKLEKLDYRLRKAELDLQFLCKCDDNNIIPNFLNFRLANSHLKYSSTYRLCHLNLLREEIRQKKSALRSLQEEFSSLKVSLQMILSWLILLTSAIFPSELMTRFWNQKVEFNRKSSINFYRKARLKTIPKKLFLVLPSISFPILKRSSLRKVGTFVFHLSNLIMPTIWPILNCFIDKSVI